jgi:hypothetical protein
MKKNKYLKEKLIILIFILGALTIKLISIRAEYSSYKYGAMNEFKKEKILTIENKYGYGEILETLRKNKDLQLKAMNINEAEKCNIEVNYTGDIKLLYNCLCSLIESPSIIGINIISISRESNAVIINIDFKKNK